MANDIPILITPGFPGDGTINLRFSQDYRQEILDLLNEQGLAHYSILEASADVTLWIEAVAVTPASILAITAFYKVFTSRHKDARVILKRDGTEIVGYSRVDAERLIDVSIRSTEEQASSWQATTKDESRLDGED